jgi:replicative DNA helicase
MTPATYPPATGLFGRELPHSLEAEEYLLSCCFIDGTETIGRCLDERLTPEAFFAPANQKIFARLREMHADGKPLALDVLAEELKKEGKLEEIGGYSYLMQVSSKIPTTAQAGYFIERVSNLHLLRRMIQTAGGIVERAFQPGENVDAFFDEATAEFLKVVQSRVSENTDKPWAQVVADTVAHTEQRIAHTPEALRGTLDWPWPEMTKLFGPMRRGELIIPAARPSVGKSSLARAVVDFHAKAGRNVLVESMEMTGQEIAEALAAAESGICATTVADAHARDQADFLRALRAQARPNLHVFTRDHSLAAIVARAKAIHSTTPLDLLIIDYLGLISDCKGTERTLKTDAIGNVTGALKRLAMELDCVVIVLAQLNRLSAKDGNREPVITDLRDSGNIEQDANKIILLHRPNTDPLTNTDQMSSKDSEDRPRYFTNAIQGKGRSDGDGQVFSLYLRRATTKFSPAVRPTPAEKAQPQEPFL